MPDTVLFFMGEDLASLKPLYFKTAHENIDMLKAGIAKLCQNTADPAAIEEVFRSAHTLKSKSIMMGYQQIGTVAKGIEDVFYTIQKGTQKVSPDLLAIVATAAGNIETSLRQVEATNTEIPLGEDLQRLSELHTPVLPVQPSSSAVQSSITSAINILIIEDDSFFRKFYANKLQEKGYGVDTAVDGEEGLEKIMQKKPHVVLMDMIMPKKNGFEVLTNLSQDPTLKTIPVIVFSSLNQDQDVEKAKQLGAVDYVNKTLVDFDTLLKKIIQVTQKQA